jgi:hypothetical protein
VERFPEACRCHYSGAGLRCGVYWDVAGSSASLSCRLAAEILPHQTASELLLSAAIFKARRPKISRNSIDLELLLNHLGAQLLYPPSLLSPYSTPHSHQQCRSAPHHPSSAPFSTLHPKSDPNAASPKTSNHSPPAPPDNHPPQHSPTRPPATKS